MITENPSLEKYTDSINRRFYPCAWHSFLIAISVTLIALVLHAMCGYAFAKNEICREESDV